MILARRSRRSRTSFACPRLAARARALPDLTWAWAIVALTLIVRLLLVR